MTHKPVLQALVLADHIYIDTQSGKKVIAGTFNHLTSTEFPTTFDKSKYAFVSLTEIHGEIEIVIRLIDLSSGETLMELRDLSVESDDPLETVEMVVEIGSIPMPHEGSFAFEVLAGDEPIGALRLFFSQVEEPGDDE